MKTSIPEKVFNVSNIIFLGIMALLCVLPFIHILAVSLSNQAYVLGGYVKFWPMGATFDSYRYVFSRIEVLMALWVSVKRVVLGSVINMFFTIVTAYPLSKTKEQFKPRTFFAWFFVFTMLFGGGFIPLYLIMNKLSIINTMWSLVLPGAVQVFNIVLVLNFYRNLPSEIEDAAYVDGATHWDLLFRIYVFLSTPVLATVLLFTMVGHWNSWFDGMIYLFDHSKYPLQTYLRDIVVGNSIESVQQRDLAVLNSVADKTIKAALVFLGTFPILMVYPFLQKYFMKGIILGSVKG